MPHAELITALGELPFVVGATLVQTAPGPKTSMERVTNPMGGTLVRLEFIDDSSTLFRLVDISRLGPRDVGLLENEYVVNGPAEIHTARAISSKLAQALVAKELMFIDHAGNCFIRVGNRFLASVQGRPAPKNVQPSHTTTRAPGYRVLHALLVDPSLVQQSQRTIAKVAGTSKQPVAHLLARLVDEGILIRRGRTHLWTHRRSGDSDSNNRDSNSDSNSESNNGEWVQGPPGALLDRFAIGYREHLHARLWIGRYRLPVSEPADIERWIGERLEPGTYRYGGTAAAERLAPYFRGADTLVHLGPVDSDIRRKLKAVPSHDGRLIWMDNLGGKQSEVLSMDSVDTVDTVLVYAELMADKNPRAQEAAGVLRQQRLAWSVS